MTQNTRHKNICLIAHQSPHRRHCEGCREPWNHTPASGAGYHGIRSWWRPDGSVLSQQHLWFHNILSHCWNLLLPEKNKNQKPLPEQTVYLHFSTVYLHVRPVIEQVQEGSQSVNILSTQEAVGCVWHEDGSRVDAAPSPPEGHRSHFKLFLEPKIQQILIFEWFHISKRICCACVWMSADADLSAS